MRKKPVKLHLLAGTYRQDRHANRGLPATIPKCPSGMTPAARKQWRGLARTLAGAGLISHVDGLSLRLLAESMDLYFTASAKVAGNSLVVKTAAGNVIQNPFLSIRNRAWEQIVKLSASFGLTPADRTGMSFSFAQDPNGIDAFVRKRERYLGNDKSRYFN